jgi:hypothetical protein
MDVESALLTHKACGKTRIVAVCSTYLLYDSVDPEQSKEVLEYLDTTVLALLKQSDIPTLLTGRLFAVLRVLGNGGCRRNCHMEPHDRTQWTL